MMSETKTQALLNGANRIYKLVNTYHNVDIPQAQAMLEGYGINESVINTAHLTTKQKGALLMLLAQFLIKIGKEASERTFESDLIASGFASPQEAIADIPNVLAGDIATQTTVNFVKTAELVALLDAEVMSDDLLAHLLQMVINIKNKVVEIQPFLNEV